MPPAENHLIARLPRADRLRLLEASEPVALMPAQVLCERGELLRHLYFPIDAFISQIAQVDHHPSLEVCLVGREGVLGAALVLGVPRARLRALVRGAGSAHRIGVASFRRELARSAALRRGVNLYLHVLMVQMACAAGCQRFHRIAPRLARWLLMCQDRAQADRFHATHECLASVLGVRRVGITNAAGELQRAGLIGYHRGEVSVLDRPGLEAAACSCYAADLQTYREWIG